jgi:hypothetical protein
MIQRFMAFWLVLATMGLAQNSETEDVVRRAPGYRPGRVAIVGDTGFLESVRGKADDCVRVDGTATPCGGTGKSINAETPAGSVDGQNRTFTLSKRPDPTASLQLYRNGVLLREGVDFVLTGTDIVVTSEQKPILGDSLVAYYSSETTARAISSQRPPIDRALLRALVSATIPQPLLSNSDAKAVAATTQRHIATDTRSKPRETPEQQALKEFLATGDALIPPLIAAASSNCSSCTASSENPGKKDTVRPSRTLQLPAGEDQEQSSIKPTKTDVHGREAIGTAVPTDALRALEKRLMQVEPGSAPSMAAPPAGRSSKTTGVRRLQDVDKAPAESFCTGSEAARALEIRSPGILRTLCNGEASH